METAADIQALNEPSLLEMKCRLSPEAYAHHLQTKGDVFWWPSGNFFVVTSHELAREVLKDAKWSADRSAFFISRMPNLDLRLITDFFAVISKMMVMSDAPDHARRRAVGAQGLDERLLELYRPRIEYAVTRLIDEASREEECEQEFDFVQKIAQPLPSMVLADLFSIPETERQNFYLWSNNMTQFFGGASQYRNEDGVEVNQSASRIRDFFTDLLARRKSKPGDDYLSLMLRNQPRFGLSDQEVVSQAIMMLVAGQITTTDQFCNNIFTLLTTPGAQAALASDPSLIPGALEEFNRLDPAVSYLFRVARERTRLGDHTVEPGQTVFISVHAANRDARVFKRPDMCFLKRVTNPHLAYGHGPHYCLGAKLARVQMQSCFRQLITRFPRLRLAGGEPPVRKHHSLAFSGFERLRLQYI